MLSGSIESVDEIERAKIEQSIVDAVVEELAPEVPLETLVSLSAGSIVAHTKVILSTTTSSDSASVLVHKAFSALLNKPIQSHTVKSTSVVRTTSVKIAVRPPPPPVSKVKVPPPMKNAPSSPLDSPKEEIFTQTTIIALAAAGVVALFLFIFLARACDPERIRETMILLTSLYDRVMGRHPVVSGGGIGAGGIHIHTSTPAARDYVHIHNHVGGAKHIPKANIVAISSIPGVSTGGTSSSALTNVEHKIEVEPIEREKGLGKREEPRISVVVTPPPSRMNIDSKVESKPNIIVKTKSETLKEEVKEVDEVNKIKDKKEIFTMKEVQSTTNVEQERKEAVVEEVKAKEQLKENKNAETKMQQNTLKKEEQKETKKEDKMQQEEVVEKNKVISSSKSKVPNVTTIPSLETAIMRGKFLGRQQNEKVEHKEKNNITRQHSQIAPPPPSPLNSLSAVWLNAPMQFVVTRPPPIEGRKNNKVVKESEVVRNNNSVDNQQKREISAELKETNSGQINKKSTPLFPERSISTGKVYMNPNELYYPFHTHLSEHELQKMRQKVTSTSSTHYSPTNKKSSTPPPQG